MKDLKNIKFKYEGNKNLIIKERCGYSFEDAISAIVSQKLLNITPHPNKNKYPHQQIFVIRIKNYVYALPFVYNQNKNEVFLKTMYPSRKLTKEHRI